MRELDGYVKEFKSGDTRNFPDFYDKTKKIVYYSIICIVKSEVLTEDLMQDTYIRFLERLDSYKIGTKVESFLATMARNIALNEYNRRRREIIDSEGLEKLEDSRKEPNSEVFELLKFVSDEEREIIILHIINNLKFKEIAKIVDKPLGTVLWIYNKGIKSLRERRNELL